MQALSVWPSKSSLCTLPLVESDLASCLYSCRRKKVGIFAVSLFHNSIYYGHFLFSAGSRYGRSSNGFTCRYPKLRFHIVAEKKKDCACSSVASAWELDEEETQSLVRSSTQSNTENENIDGESHEFDRVDASNGISDPEGKIDVRELAKSLHAVETADDVEEVLKDTGIFPIRVYSSLIRGFGWDKKMKPALAVVDWLRRKKVETGGAFIGPNLFVYNSLLTVVKDCEQYQEAEKVVNDMAREGIHPNVVTYNILMMIHVEQEQPSKALSIFEQICQKGFTPSAASYSIALMAYRRMEDGDGALKFFVEFKEKYVKGELGRDNGDDEDWEKEFAKLEDFTIRICYQVMRRWLTRLQDMSTKVFKLLTSMDNAGLQTSRAEYERLIWACTREDHYRVAKELYTRVRERYPEISLSVCNHLIWLMGKAKKWWAALEIYEDLLDKGPSPNNLSSELIISHFNVLLAAASKRGIWRWGVRLLNKMQDKGLKPESRQWNAVLVACSKAAETSAAVEIFKRMVEQGEKPTIISYGALLSALEKAGLYEEAFRVWNHMLKMEVQPNLYAYTIMASVLTGQGKFRLVDSIIKEMVDVGIPPTVVTYNAIISGCARRGLSSAAYEWFHRMEKQQDVGPNEISYQMLIEALVRDGKPRLAYEAYLRAQNDGIVLSSKAYDAVVDASRASGATIDVSLLGDRPPERRKGGGGVRIRKTLTEFTRFADVPRRSQPFDKREIYYRQGRES
ncbi:unnamed protein product [Linum tenue]|uniref:PROP1-like PPR domain-containing protein n=1 Tax=Linum tenue TaxID=586396 RepID=A0AAV0NE04_9ROSI|nr:unnamed protein product [Linum tenue]